MSSNFLEVDESLFNRKFLLSNDIDVDRDDDDEDSSPAFPWLKEGNKSKISEAAPIVTPSQRAEASQCKFIIPTPGTCVKTKDNTSGKKFFVNFCYSDMVPEPQLYYNDDELRHILSSGSDTEVDDLRIPISIGEKNVATDSAGAACLTVDVIMNTTFYNNKFLVSDIYREFFIVVAFEGIEAKHKVALDKDTYNILKNKKCLGKPAPQFVRSKAGIHEITERSKEANVVNPGALPFPKRSPPDNSSKVHLAENSMEIDSATESLLKPVTTKRLVQEVKTTKDSHLNCVVTQHSEDLATATIKIPNLLNPKKLSVTIGADRLIVDCPVGSLDIFLPLDFHQEKSRAEYDPATSILSLHLPLVVKPEF